MNRLKFGVLASTLLLLSACGPETEEGSEAAQGILSNQQQQALEAANSVEQTLLNSAADREKELEARLRSQ